MNDAQVVSSFEGIRDLPRDWHRLVDRDGASCYAFREVLTLDQFHHERGHPTFLQAVDTRDVWMIQ